MSTGTIAEQMRRARRENDQRIDYLEHLDPARVGSSFDGVFHFHTVGGRHVVWTGIAAKRVYTLQTGARTGPIADAVKALADALTAEAAAFFDAEAFREKVGRGEATTEEIAAWRAAHPWPEESESC